MAELPDLSRRLENLSRALQRPSLTELDQRLAVNAKTTIDGTTKPNFYNWPNAKFQTVVEAGTVKAVGGEWKVAQRGRQSGKHGRTSGHQTWTKATEAARRELDKRIEGEVSDLVRKATGD